MCMIGQQYAQIETVATYKKPVSYNKYQYWTLVKLEVNIQAYDKEITSCANI